MVQAAGLGGFPTLRASGRMTIRPVHMSNDDHSAGPGVMHLALGAASTQTAAVRCGLRRFGYTAPRRARVQSRLHSSHGQDVRFAKASQGEGDRDGHVFLVIRTVRGREQCGHC
jgi:hypothetical protein